MLEGWTRSPRSQADRAAKNARIAWILIRCRVPVSSLRRPDRGLRALGALRRWGTSPAGAFVAAALRGPELVAVVDELGSLSYAEVDAQSNAVARALAERGVGVGHVVALMARNHRGFVIASVAVAKLGADVLYLNTMFAGPQIQTVCAREDVGIVIHDQEFTELFDAVLPTALRVLSWVDDAAHVTTLATLDRLAKGDRSSLQPPAKPGRQIILTSGTTGMPKGAQRPTPRSIAPIAAFLERIPYRAGDSWLLAAPVFHTWGFFNWVMSTALGGTAVMPRRFDPESTLRWIENYRCQHLVVVPVMLQRIVDLGPEVIDRYDLSSLRVIAVSGSALPGELAVRATELFGDVVHNLYGSTEVAIATIATPDDLRQAPGTAGRATRWTDVRVVGDDGAQRPQGEVGRIFVRNELAFDAYTGGDEKERIDGLLSSGDVGHLDAAGRLFIDGRDDEMIITGGENVFPREIEDLLSDHDAIEEVSVIGVPDERWGQGLRAFVVARPGAQIDADDVRAHVKAHLAGYKVPREVVFLDHLPRNATGKVLRRRLADEQRTSHNSE